MWFRIAFYLVCFLAFVNSIPQVGDQFTNFQTPLGNDRPHEQGISSSLGSNQNFNNRESEIRPSERPTGEFGQSSRPNQEHLGGRPSGELINTVHREGENRPSGSKPTNTGENSFGRPTGGSSHSPDHKESGSRPTGSTNSGGNSVSRPTGSTTHATEHKKGEKNPTGLIDGQHGGRPTEGFDNNKQTGVRPEQFSGGSTQSSHQENHPTEQTDKNKETEEGKEDEKDVCFERLGCFKMGKPWKSVLRPIAAPHGPEKIQTTINFYSRGNLEKPKNITLYPQINMGEVHFDPSKITTIIVHGFSNSGNATWLRDMKNVYLKKVDANVMIVDWGKGAQLSNYLQVAGNTRVVGKQLGVFVKHLIDKYGADPGKFHLIGHSLGAQICSYLGKETPGLARLTALDPAQPGFEGFDSEVRLDKNDAQFVDVIHTDAKPFIPTLGYGMIAPYGHVDFYMNGGFDQPGCVPPSKKDLPSITSFLDLAKYPVEVISQIVSCPHGRAHQYLIESFNETENCIFWGHKADVKNIFKSVTNTVTQGLLKKFTALSSTCSKEDCIPLGFATKKSPLRGVFVVTTNSKPPYCISEPGIPPETEPESRKFASNIQKIARRTGLVH